MKYSTLLIFLLFSTSFLYSQGNFKLEGNEIIWQKVFATDLSFEEVKNNLIVSGIYDRHEIYNNQLIGQLRPFDLKYREAGYTKVTVPTAAFDNDIDAFSVLEFKDGRYRVTLKNIALNKLYDDKFTSLGEKTTFEELALDSQGAFKNSFLKHYRIYETTFEQLFTINPEPEEDW